MAGDVPDSNALSAPSTSPDTARATARLFRTVCDRGSIAAASRHNRTASAGSRAAVPHSRDCSRDTRQRGQGPCLLELLACRIELAELEQQGAQRVVPGSGGDGPSIDTARNNLAVALAVSGDVEGAVNAFESGTSPAIAAYNQGMVLAADGQLDRARTAFGLARRPTRRFYRPSSG